MGTPILAGTNFHVKNDISTRMATGEIRIAGIHTVQSTYPAILSMDKLDTRQRLVKVNSKVNIVPGEMITFTVPPGFPPDCEVAVEPNLMQAPFFFTPHITHVQDSKFSVEYEGSEVLHLEKNCQAVFIRKTTEVKQVHNFCPNLLSAPLKLKSTEQIIDKINMTNMSASERKPFADTIAAHSNVFQPDLLGYNNAYGTVFAHFEWASKARPIPQKLRALSYGSHGAMLYNVKCQQLIDKGVLIRPMEHGIQPIIINNSWLVKKNNATAVKKSFYQCTDQDSQTRCRFRSCEQIPSRSSWESN
jgi:hypothetical protein